MGSFFSREENKEIKKACIKCGNYVDNLSYFLLPKCNHVVCKRCICEYLKNFSTCNIICPGYKCMELIPDSIVRECLTASQLEKYDRLCLPSIARSCLINGCTGVVAVVEPRGHFECRVCDQPNCITCNNLHKLTETCGISINKKQYEDTGAAKVLEKRRLELIQLTRDNNLIRNPEKSECVICTEFLLPKKGILIFPCNHNFCQNCLGSFLKTKDVLTALTCGKCDTPLEHKECIELIGEVKLRNLCIDMVKYQYYHCKTPNCNEFWDAGQFKGVHKCGKCHEDNCMGCNTVHKNMSCEQYKETKEYKTILADEKFKKQKMITCFFCNFGFTKIGGCGAVRCSHCGKQVCAFSGKELGPNGCKCTSRNPCDKDCKYGCIPEGDSKYETELRKYFNDN